MPVKIIKTKSGYKYGKSGHTYKNKAGALKQKKGLPKEMYSRVSIGNKDIDNETAWNKIEYVMEWG